MLYFSKILRISLSMLSKFESHWIKGLGVMIFQNYHKNAKTKQDTAGEAGRSHAAASAATQPAWAGRNLPRSCVGSHAACVGGRQVPRSCVGPAPCPAPALLQAKKKKKKKKEKFYACKPT